jgi:hypothetical protein
MPYLHPHVSGTERISFSKHAHRNLVIGSAQVFFSLSAFCRRFLVQTSVGQMQIIPFFSHNILKLALSHMTKASAKSTQYSLGKESSRDFQTCGSRLIVACHKTASGQFAKCSLHLITLQWVPCASLKLIV